MDFRQCPACQASVLDDDAADCPFCGASMSSKPTAAPAKPTAAKTAAPAGEKAKAPPEAPKRQAPPRRVGETVADDDDPFGIETSTVTQVPKVAPKQVKGRSIRIQCPMCETPGYISSKMQGRDVKCCNENCMVPVFKAPRPPKKTEEVKKTSAVSGKVMGIGAGVLVLVGGLLFWGFYLSRQQGTVVDDGGGAGGGFVRNKANIGGNDPEPVKPGNGGQPRVPQVTPLAEIKSQSLKQIVTVAQVRDDNRKAYGRRMAAEAHALVGDIKGAREQLDQLRKRSVGGDVPYFQIEPLMLIAWHQLAAGNAAEATATMQQATTAYTGLSQVGREVLTAGIALAAGQVASDQIPAASGTLRKLEAEIERARVAALIHIAANFETYDVDELLKYTSLSMVVDPLAVAVAVDLAAHGQWDRAVAWATAQREPASQEDCLATVATFAGLKATRTGDPAPVTTVQGAAGLSPTGQARLTAGLASGYLMGGDTTRAQELLDTALQTFTMITKPQPLAAPTVKEVHDSSRERNAGLPNDSPLQSAAAAALSLGRLQAALGQQEAGWQTLVQAWDFTAGIAPGYSSVMSLVNELENRRSRTEAKLKQQLNLRSSDNDGQFRALNQYRGQLRLFEEAAQKRMSVERSLLRNAAEMGFAKETQAFRQNPQAMSAAAAGQPYQEAADDDQLMKVFAQSETEFAAGNFKAAAQTLSGFSDRHHIEERRDQRALQLACRLMREKNVDGLLSFVDAINDPWLAEDALELACAMSVSLEQAPVIWKRYTRYDLQPTEKVAIFRGLVAGIVTNQQPAAPAKTAQAE